MTLRRPTRLLPPMTTTGVLVLLTFFALGFFATRIHFVACRIFGHHGGFELTQEQAQTAHDLILMTNPHRAPLVPKLVHQIFYNWNDPANETVPSDWNEMRQSIRKFNPDYEYKLWTLSSARQFLQDAYPWFLETYDALPYLVQKSDMLRYFLMRHFGGIYMDLHHGCASSLDSLLHYPTWVLDGPHRGARGPLSNSILGAEPKHPFWIDMTENIKSYAHSYLFPYLTVNYATGPWFETLMWDKYHAATPRYEPTLMRVRMDQFDVDNVIFTTAGRDSRWKGWDDGIFLWLGNHLVLTACALGVIVVSGCLFYFWSRLASILRRVSRGYTVVRNHDD